LFLASPGVTFEYFNGLLGNMGAALFTNFYPPNTSVADQLYGNYPGDPGVCPQNQGDTTYKPGCASASSQASAYASANSKHTAGVNVCLADGSIRFVNTSVSPTTWLALGTMSAGEVLGDY
jgi:hypothetical protein